MKYSYRVVAGALDTAGHYTKRPIVEVEISHAGAGRKFLALIDSGADQITMPAAIADVLGIDRSTCPPRTMMGITMERTEGFVAQVTIRLSHHSEHITVPAVFIDTDVPVLLGQEGFFDRYRIKFEKDHDTFEIALAPQR
jgi:hypothetical protein